MCTVSVQINQTLLKPSEIVQELAGRRGPLDIYCWYEGPQGLPRSGATFYKESFFEPLLRQKEDVTLNIYSLKGWDFGRTASNMCDTPLGKAINRLNNVAIQALYSSSFFQYSLSIPQESPLYRLVLEELPKKQWLAELSKGYKPKGQSVAHLLEEQPSLFDAIRDLDVSEGYSYMQYIEGYYLIKKAVEKAINQDLSKVQVAFVLPNDEGKYYKDLPQDLEPMLQADFGQALNSMEIDTSFLFFPYGDKLSARPYIDRSKSARNVTQEEIPFYLPAAKTTVLYRERLNEEAC